MSKRLAILISCMMVAAAGIPAAAEDPFGPAKGKEGDKPAAKKGGEKGDDPFGGGAEKGGKGKDKGKGKDAFGGGAVFGEQDPEELAQKFGLDDDQKEKVSKLKALRDKATERYDKANEKKVAAAEEKLQKLLGANEKDRRVMAAKQQLMGFLKSVETNREKLTDQFDRKMFSLLKPEQRGKWNSPVLFDAMNKEFGALFLEPDQEQKLQTLCDAQAKRLSIPLNPEKHAKQLEGLHMVVYKSILNKKQRAEYRQAKAEAQKKNERGVRK